MKLTVLGGGGVRMPAFVRSVLVGRPGVFSEICLLEPDPGRRATIGRLAAEIAVVVGQPGVVTITDDAERALTGADYVFSAIRVGGDAGRVIDEQVALRRGIVGQETTGAGGCAMALRTIPVVLDYCELLARCSPDAVLINFTNPAGLITQAITTQGKVRAVGVCDTPSGTIEQLTSFFEAEEARAAGLVSAGYGGLNHLGWVTSFVVDGAERIGEALARFTELRRHDRNLAAFDPELVRRVGAIPTEYLFYYYDSRRYLDGVARAGTSRGEDVAKLNAELLAAISAGFGSDGVGAAWAAYDRVLGVRHDTYMRADTGGDNTQAAARARRAARDAAPITGGEVGGYEGLALRVIDGLAGRAVSDVIVNTRNDGTFGFLDDADVVEVPARADASGLAKLGRPPELPAPAQALVMSVKEYERGVVEAAMTGDAGLAAVALAQHPLVPGITAARELIAEYIDAHGEYLAYLR